MREQSMPETSSHLIIVHWVVSKDLSTLNILAQPVPFWTLARNDYTILRNVSHELLSSGSAFSRRRSFSREYW